MTKLKQPIQLETAFDQYTLNEQIGEGGAGRVFGGQDSSGAAVAIKILTSNSTDKRRRFKNEIAFLSRNRHPNIVSVIDTGLAAGPGLQGPFYVMQRFAGSLRSIIAAAPTPDTAMHLFSQILDGVEAAHLLGVTHRDLKPENVLTDSTGDQVAVADFGIARFTEDQLHTLVETVAASRLANFQYAAPEQRAAGNTVAQSADIYALGLILNELFTGAVAHGTEYRRIGSISAAYAFLDEVVASMIRQNPSDRPASVAEVKTLIQRYKTEAVSLQKINEANKTVIPEGEITDPLAHQPPKIVGAEHDGHGLILTLDQPISREWIQALYNMGNYSSLMHVPPTSFQFNGNTAKVGVEGRSAQAAIDHFKAWLPIASRELKRNLELAALRAKQEREERLKRERIAEEQKLEVNRALKF